MTSGEIESPWSGLIIHMLYEEDYNDLFIKVNLKVINSKSEINITVTLSQICLDTNMNVVKIFF